MLSACLSEFAAFSNDKKYFQKISKKHLTFECSRDIIIKSLRDKAKR